MAGIRVFSMMLVIVAGFMIDLTGAVARAERAEPYAITIAADPSLKPAFQDLVPMFEKEQGMTVRLIYGPSTTLRRQIERGAPFDVFFATVDEVQKLHSKGLTVSGGTAVCAQTRLVLVMSNVSPATSISFRELMSNRVRRIAIGNPKTSALGEITARALKTLDPAYKTRLPLLHGEHSGEIVNLVHAGKADVGIVYRVDAINSGQVWIIDEAPAGMYVPVQFGHAVVSTRGEEALQATKQFIDFMMSPRIQKLLLQYGFDAVPSNGLHGVRATSASG